MEHANSSTYWESKGVPALILVVQSESYAYSYRSKIVVVVIEIVRGVKASISHQLVALTVRACHIAVCSWRAPDNLPQPQPTAITHNKVARE